MPPACDTVAIAQATADEDYYTKRYGYVLDNPDDEGPPTGISAPPHWDAEKRGIHHTSNHTAVYSRAKVLDARTTRESLVETCVNRLIKLETLSNVQSITREAAATASTMADNQHNIAVQSYNNMLGEKESKARIIEVNTYYSKEYNAYIDILKTIFVFCIPLVALGMLNKEKILDDTTYFRFSLLIIIIALLMTAYKINDMYWRNNMNYDNYEWLYSNPRKDDTLQRSLAGIQGNLLSVGGTCSGSDCCNATTYWSGSRCITNPTHPWIGQFYYCAGGEKAHVTFRPSGEKKGEIEGSKINGRYVVKVDDNMECKLFIREITGEREYVATLVPTTTDTQFTTVPALKDSDETTITGSLNKQESSVTCTPGNN